MVSKYVHNPDMKFIDILGKAAYFFFLLLLCIAVPSSPTFSLLSTNLVIFILYSSPIKAYFIRCSLSVPTVDTTRANWLLEQMVKVKRPVVLVGESGTSKTATIQNFLSNLNTDTTVRPSL